MRRALAAGPTPAEDFRAAGFLRCTDGPGDDPLVTPVDPLLVLAGRKPNEFSCINNDLPVLRFKGHSSFLDDKEFRLIFVQMIPVCETIPGVSS